MINGHLWRLRTAPWRDVPAKYAPWKTLHERLRLWIKDGTREAILDQVQVKDDAVGKVDWIFSADSTNVRATTMRQEPLKGAAGLPGSSCSRSTVRHSAARAVD